MAKNGKPPASNPSEDHRALPRAERDNVNGNADSKLTHTAKGSKTAHNRTERPHPTENIPERGKSHQRRK